jgi:hypothetical protein
MKLKLHAIAVLLLSLAGLCAPVQSVQAQAFNDNARDLILTFRKTGFDGSGDIGQYVFEVDLGQASIYYGAAAGSAIPITAYSATDQLATLFDSLNDLSWSVGGCVPNAGDSGDPSIPNSTLWVTEPRQVPNVPASPAWHRSGSFTQGQADSKINSILDNAATWAASTPPDPLTNAPSFAAIPAGDVYNANGSLGGAGNYLGTFQGDVEATTLPTFTTDGTNSISDFYELEPGSGPGTYLGYFELSTNGAMTFYAGPFAMSYPAPTLSVSTDGAGDVFVSFPSTANGTYTLFYTNTAGLTSPVSAWAAVSTNIIGDGTVKSFQQTISGKGTFYAVGVH